MATIQELQETSNVATRAAVDAVKAFEELRKEGSAEELVKAASTVTSTKRVMDKAEFEVNTFELVGIYEGIKEQTLKAAEKWDFKTLLSKEITTVRIDVPFGSDGIAVEQVSVNTLGRKVAVRASGGGGQRSRYVYGPDGQNSRDYVAAHGPEAGVEAEQIQKTLDEPSKFGLTHLADRIATKLGHEKTTA